MMEVTMSKYILKIDQAEDEKTMNTVIKQLLEDKREFKFSHYIEHIQKKEFDTSEVKLLNTLNLFAWGNYHFYKRNESLFLKLTNPMIKKLKILSLLGMFKKTKQLHCSIPLERIRKQLVFQDTRAVKKFVKNLIQNGIFTGSLTHKKVKKNKKIIYQNRLVIKFEHILTDREFEIRNTCKNVYKLKENYYCEICKYGTVFGDKIEISEHLEINDHDDISYKLKYTRCIHCSRLMAHYYNSNNKKPLHVSLCTECPTANLNQ